jgi:hypothetical protein
MKGVNTLSFSRRKFLEVGALCTTSIVSSGLAHSMGRAEKSALPIDVNTQNLTITVDSIGCRWSAQVKGTPMQLNHVYFLPGDDPSGWKISSSVNNDDTNELGSFVTVTLHGTKPDQLDFEYQISASKTGNDILVSLGRANNTSKPVDIEAMDYFVSADARLGGTTDRWISLGTHTFVRDYYELAAVVTLIRPTVYAVNQVVSDQDTGNSFLMGHTTNKKGESSFELIQGWAGKTPDRMQIRGYCTYKVTMPAGEKFAGEKLLINFGNDAIRAMEHQADLISLANDIRLKERRPIDLDDREWVANYSRFHGWMSGGTNEGAKTFFKENGLVDFYWGIEGPARGSIWGLYGVGGSTLGQRPRINYPAECYLPIHTVIYGATRVIDFSNPLTVSLERERALKWVADLGSDKNKTGRVEMDFADPWDKWPGQYNPYMSSLETYHACGDIWREIMDQQTPHMVIRSNMERLDYSYGLVDICRISEDADQGYEDAYSPLVGKVFNGLLNESVLGMTSRFFYNGRVFWNDGDGFHIYEFKAPHLRVGSFNYGQAKVDAHFHAFAGSTLFLSESLHGKYPEDRIELLKRICPPTMDVSYPVDLFVRRPAQVWAMPIERPFGKWCLLAVFNYTSKTAQENDVFNFTTQVSAARDLRLDPDKEYIVYEFWSKQLLGTFKGTFATRPLNPYDVDIYSIVEKQDHPVLISTSRHIRQMAFDIKDLKYNSGQRALSGVSRAVAGDPYQLRIYLPDGFSGKRVELSGGLTATMETDGNLLMVNYTTSNGDDVTWKVYC